MAPSEVELKFRLDEEQRRAIEVRLGAAGEPRRLESIYFDGSGLPMRRAGYSVRVRSDEGRRTMTVKTLAFAAQRGEWTRPQQDETPDRAFLFSTPAGVALDGEALLPQFQTETLRSDLLLQEGETVGQASFDEGRTSAGALASPFAE
ncbi:MAG: CYTH domain-containing protein, partial [Caulobacteraceae bacterium]